MKHLSEINLDSADRQAVGIAGEILRSRLGATEVLLFGSKARGTSTRESDIDLLVILPRPVRAQDRQAAVDALYDTQLRLGVLFSPVLVNIHDWAGDLYGYLPLRLEVDRDGVRV